MIATPHSTAGCPFDRVVFDEDGTAVTYSCDEFRQMALSVRIRRILQNRPRFFRDGQEIPRSEALALGSS